MQAIKEFEYWECTPGSSEKKYIGVKQIKEELRYPAIKFLNSSGKKIDVSDWKSLIRYNIQLNSYYFTKEEMEFLANIYHLKLKKRIDHAGKEQLITTNEKVNELYVNSANFKLIEDDDKEYLIIQFNRFENENQKNSRMWDYYGEPITYIHGIWEAPLLTDKIIEKIKNPNR